MDNINSIFSSFARWTAHQAGKPHAFILAVTLTVIWAITGPFFNYSDTWQLIINTSTTICTFWMVFLLQNTQDRDTKAIQLKLDELIRVNKKASDSLIGFEKRDDKEC